MSQYICTECGTVGTEDDGISGPGDACPDAAVWNDGEEGCGGLMQWTEDGYTELLDGLHDKLTDALTDAYEALDVRLTIDDLHIALDAVAELRHEIASKNPERRKPWEEYG